MCLLYCLKTTHEKDHGKIALIVLSITPGIIIEYETIPGKYHGTKKLRRPKQGTFYKLSDSFGTISHSSSM